MSRIPVVEENQAEGMIREVYEGMKSQMGVVPNVVKIMSGWPELFEANMKMFQTVMISESALPRPVKEMIAALTSKLNQCSYCLSHHVNFMKQYGVSPEIADTIGEDYRKAGVDQKTLKLLEYAEKVTKHAYKVTDADIAGLKEAGWSDREILEATAVVAQFSFINRIADALGVELEASGSGQKS